MKGIVIKISEDDYWWIKQASKGTTSYPITLRMYEAIKNSKELPKGYGDLVDINELEECKEIMRTISGESKFAVRMDDIRNVSPIIEADKGNENEESDT